MARKCVNLNAPEVRELHQLINADVTLSSISPQLVATNIGLWQENNSTNDFPTLPELKEFMKVQESEKIKRSVVTLKFSPAERRQRVRYLTNRFSEVVTALFNRDRQALRDQLVDKPSEQQKEQILRTLNLMERSQSITETYGVKQIWDLVKWNFLEKAIEDPTVPEDIKAKKQKILDNFSELIRETSPILKATEGISIYADSGVVKISDSYQENMDEIDQKNDILEQEEHSSKEDYDFRSEKTSSLDILSARVRSLLSVIPRVDFNGVEETDDLGTPIYLDMDIAQGALIDTLEGMHSIEEMVPLLEGRLAEFPWFRGIIDNLNRSSQLRNLFYSDFNKTFIQYNYVDKASNVSKPLNANLRLKPLIDRYIENINTGVELSKDSIYTKENTIDSNKVNALRDKAISLQTDYKKASTRGEALTEKLREGIENVLHSIGISYTPSLLNNILFSYGRKDTKNIKDPVNIILSNSIQILSGLKNSPLKVSTDLVSSYKGKYNAIARLFFSEAGSREASHRFNGDSYYSYMLPNYLSKLVSGIKKSNFNEYIQDKFKKYSFFYDKVRGKWMNGLMEKLENSEEARNRFGIHTVLADRSGNPYMKWGFLDTIITKMTEFGSFSNEKDQYAGFMVPVMSDAPKCYFMTLPKIVESPTSSVKEQAIDRLTDIVFQEYLRINLVRDREKRMAAGENISPVTNFDVRASSDKVGGAQFKIIPALNSYRVPISTTESVPFLQRMDDLMNRKTLGEDVNSIIIDEINDALSNTLTRDFKSFMEKLRAEGAFSEDESGNFPFPGMNVESTGIPTLKKSLENIRRDLLKNRPGVWNDSLDNFLNNIQNYSQDRVISGITELKSYLRNNNLSKVADRIVYNNILLNKIESFFYNDLVAAGDIYQLLTTDLAFYSTLIDLSKRFKQVQGSTQKLAWSPGTKQRVVIMKDSDVPAGGLDQIKAIYDTAVKEGELPSSRRDQLVEKLSDITETDGQAIISLGYYKRIMEAGGNWNQELERVYQKMMSPKQQVWSVGDYSVLFQIIKPFVYTQRSFQDPKSDGVMPVPFQNKNSIFVLTPQYAKGKPELEAMLQYMEEHNVDIVQFQSAVKVGNQGNLSINGTTKEEIVNNLNSQTSGKESQIIFEIDPNDFGVQVSTVPHFLDTEALVGSQLKKIEMKDIPDDSTFGVKDKTLTKQELWKVINDLHLSNQEAGLKGVEEIFESDNTLSEEVTSELMKDGRFGLDAINASSIASDGKPTLPFFTPSRASKILPKLISIIKSRVSKQTMAGGAYIQATSLGIKSEDLEVKFSEDGKKLEYIECLVPAWSKDLFEPLIDKKTGLLDIDKKDSSGNLIFPEGARKMIAYRIPTENGYSILPLRIKGFLPQQAGGAIITNPLVFPLTGSDLDVDKLFFLRPSIEKVSVASTEMVSALIENFSPYGQVSSDTFKRVKSFVEKAITDQPVDLTPLEMQMYEFIKAHPELLDISFKVVDYGSIEKAAQSKDKRARDNALFDSYWSIMTSEAYTKLSIRPGNFDSLKQASRIALLLNRDNTNLPKSIEALSKMSIKELDKLLDSTISNPLSPLHIVDVQVRNTVGKNLIAIIANHNSHYAATQSMGLKVGSKYQFRIDNSVLDDVSKASIGNQKLSLALCEYLAAIVDNAKDPVLGDMGVTPTTINASMAMVRSGFTPIQITLFMNQPSIKRALASYNKDLSSYKDVEDFVDREIKNYTKAREAFSFAVGDKWYPNYEFTSKQFFNNIKVSKESVGLEGELEKARSGNDASYAAYLESQVSVLRAFKRSIQVGEYLSQMIGNSKFDTTNGAPSKSPARVIKTIVKLRNFWNDHVNESEPIISGDLLVRPTEGLGKDTKEIINTSHMPFIQGMYSHTYGVMKEIYGRYFPFFKDYILNSINNLSRNSKRGVLSENEIDEFLNDYITYRVSRLPSLGTEVLDDGTIITAQEKRGYFINKFPREFSELRNSIPELAQNDFIQRIKVYRAKDSNSSGSTFKSPTLLFENSGGINSLDRERLTNSWRELLYSDNEKVRYLAIDLFKYAYFKNGLGFGPTSWMHLVPIEVEFSVEGYREELMRIQEEDSEDMDTFTDQFILNHIEDKNILPYAPEIANKEMVGRIEDGTVTIDINKDIEGDTGLFKWLISYTSQKALVPKDIVAVTVGKTPKVFKLLSQSEDTLIYGQVSRLGLRNAYKEYSYGDNISDMKSQVGEYVAEDNVLNTGVVSSPIGSTDGDFDVAGKVAEAQINGKRDSLTPTDMPMPDLMDQEYNVVQDLEELAEEQDCPF